MNMATRYIRNVSSVLLCAALLCACRNHATDSQLFVGKWQSSRLTTPLHLYANGEWEIKAESGAVLQYGVWEYKNDRIVWSYSVDGHVAHDANAVLAAKPGAFQLRERDGTTTSFSKIGP